MGSLARANIPEKYAGTGNIFRMIFSAPVCIRANRPFFPGKKTGDGN